MRLEDDILYLMSLVLFRYFDGMSKEFVRRKIGRSEWRCLAVLAETGSRNVGELVELTQQPQTTMSRVIGRMERLGWLTRLQREGDARFIEVQISQKGRDKLAEILPAVTRQHELAVRGVSDREMDSMHAALRTILANLVGDSHPVTQVRNKTRARASGRGTSAKSQTGRSKRTRNLSEVG